MNTNKFRRAHSLRIPRSPKPSTFLDSSGVYDRLDEMEIHDDHRGHNESSGNRDNSFSLEIPLILEAPKLQYCRKKWSSKSLRLPKTQQAEAVCNGQAKEVTHMDHSIQNSNKKTDTFNSHDERSLSSDSQSYQKGEDEGDKQKGKKMKNYKKTIDRAFRRGWGTFITNIYTISLTRTSQDYPHLVKAC